MDKIILKNQTSFEIADGASLGNIQIKAENFDTIKTITDTFTAENIAEATFTHNGETSGKYTDLKSDGFTYMPNVGEDGAEDGTYTVTVRLRTKTEMEKAIDELKAGHEANAEAIQELASIATESEVQDMVKFYVRRILVDKKMTIDEVPMRWRTKVQEEIEKQLSASLQ